MCEKSNNLNENVIFYASETRKNNKKSLLTSSMAAYVNGLSI